MPDPNVIIPPDLSRLLVERDKVWADFDTSQTLSAELNKLASSVPECTPAKLQLQFGAGSTPPAELEAILPRLKGEIAAARKLKTEVKSCYNEIERIQRQEKIMLTVGAGVAVVVLLALFIAVLSLIS